jgi:hypothetical protein
VRVYQNNVTIITLRLIDRVLPFVKNAVFALNSLQALPNGKGVKVRDTVLSRWSGDPVGAGATPLPQSRTFKSVEGLSRVI